MQGARASCTEILLIALMAAFRECGIDHEPIILVSEHAVIAKTEKMPWDDATAAVIVQLLRNCNQAGSFEFEGILLAHQMLQQSDFRSKTSTVFVFSDGYTGNQRCATERLNYPRKQRVSFNGISMRSIFRCAQYFDALNISIRSIGSSFRSKYRFAQFGVASLGMSLRPSHQSLCPNNNFVLGSAAITFAMLERETTMPKRNATHGIEGALLFHQKMDQICSCLRIQAFGLVRRDLIYA
jgi:hypothetical protein